MNQTHLPHDPDGFALAEACHASDRRAQRALWERFKNRMFGVCLRFATSQQEAEDWLQEAFIQIFRDIGQYRGNGSLEGWIRRIVVRTALQHLQKQHLLTYAVDELQMEQIVHALEVAEGGIEDDPGRLVTLLQHLPPGFRTVLNLYVIEERSHEEIARELGITVGTSKSQLHRAKAFMRRLLDKTLLLL
ncbi:MAG: RNA polymerase sigma factor [Saprospiraceae bacterium]